MIKALNLSGKDFSLLVNKLIFIHGSFISILKWRQLSSNEDNVFIMEAHEASSARLQLLLFDPTR